MDQIRLRKLAGMETSVMEEYEASVKELDLMEKMYQGKHGLGIDTDVTPIEEIQKRMEAATRGLGIVNKLRDPEYKKQQLGRVMSNLNTIRAALAQAIKQAEGEGWLK